MMTMKHQIFPLHITLSEVPPVGRSFIYTREGGELNQGLEELIGSNEYELKFFIQPIDSQTYELRGHLRTKIEPLCSLCAHPWSGPLTKPSMKFLSLKPIPNLERPKKPEPIMPANGSIKISSAISFFQTDSQSLNLPMKSSPCPNLLALWAVPTAKNTSVPISPQKYALNSPKPREHPPPFPLFPI